MTRQHAGNTSPGLERLEALWRYGVLDFRRPAGAAEQRRRANSLAR
jgi:hypothetical protein